MTVEYSCCDEYRLPSRYRFWLSVVHRSEEVWPDQQSMIARNSRLSLTYVKEHRAVLLCTISWLRCTLQQTGVRDLNGCSV